eukprot:TRINITY_DN13295_c0_g1_i1.p2 TRINITY_DN13295_c0_g1~~TRINITY_DN13295_c0_g1_i1.p2  ORF type:complete len:83 (+),score=8.98 TRINITY_DN13295_c0_g1_i1:127-375(+)
MDFRVLLGFVHKCLLFCKNEVTVWTCGLMCVFILKVEMCFTIHEYGGCAEVGDVVLNGFSQVSLTGTFEAVVRGTYGEMETY